MVTTVSRRIRTSSALLTVAGVVLTGCSSGGAAGILATYDADGGMDALLIGTVSISQECVTVRTADQVTTPAFDGGAQVRGAVLVFRGAEYPDGAKIELPGGEASDATGVSIPGGCPSDHIFLVAPD